jgi:hypothetical protein
MINSVPDIFDAYQVTHLTEQVRSQLGGFMSDTVHGGPVHHVDCCASTRTTARNVGERNEQAHALTAAIAQLASQCCDFRSNLLDPIRE